MLCHIFFKIFSHAVHTLVVTIYPYVVNVINDLSYVATVDTVSVTQFEFYVFRGATGDKFYLERTVAGDSKRTVTVSVR